MPIGNAIPSSVIFEPKTEFNVERKKSEYLKNANSPTLITIEEIKGTLAYLVFFAFSISIPCIYPDKQVKIISNTYIGSP